MPVSGKTSIMLPNNQPGTQETLRPHYDTIIFDADIDFNNSDNDNCYFDIQNSETIFFTSGSTGDYKLYSKFLSNIESESESINKHMSTYNIKDHQIYTTVSHLHLYGFSWFLIWPLLHNHTINIGRLYVPEIVNDMLCKKNSIMITTPVIISKLTEKSDIGESIVVSSASELKEYTAKQFLSCYSSQVIEVYGSSETGIIANRQQLKGTIWQTFDGVTITSDNNTLLTVCSPFFPESHHNMFDKVTIFDEHTFELHGRVDRIVKVSGKRVALSAIENHLLQHNWIYDAACLIRNTYREQVVAMICLSETGIEQYKLLSKRELTQQLRRYLLKYYNEVTIPKQWRIVSKIPLNTQGKRVFKTIIKAFEG
jgi:acyl-coenzyme A synthetase/AMP-(fatty) acid ligase